MKRKASRGFSLITPQSREPASVNASWKMEIADYEVWKKFHRRNKLWSYVTTGVWLFGLIGMIASFLLSYKVLGFVFLAFAISGPFSILFIPGYFYSFDRRYRKPRCLAAGVDPRLYMLPNVPYLFVEGGTILPTDRTWYVSIPEDGVYHASRGRVKCLVHREALHAIRGKSWHFKNFSPDPNQGNPPFVLKSSPSWNLPSTDMASVVLIDSPIFLPFPTSTPVLPQDSGLTEIPSDSSRAIHMQGCARNPPFLPKFELDLPPTYEEVMKTSQPSRSRTSSEST
ncbi:unnamed protein product [Darwinula stevensoni]|uniref:Uncharacterized protein n=1 Tax=Darwinula stevensoni TaxID=69355 RepID=A0A7R8X9H3_9CRUS|nr:unnamed protein product [Darwinula stevensoni]CAG0891107.1 unnamed protein product [Darwinula stevensoni]